MKFLTFSFLLLAFALRDCAFAAGTNHSVQTEVNKKRETEKKTHPTAFQNSEPTPGEAAHEQFRQLIWGAYRTPDPERPNERFSRAEQSSWLTTPDNPSVATETTIIFLKNQALNVMNARPNAVRRNAADLSLETPTRVRITTHGIARDYFYTTVTIRGTGSNFGNVIAGSVLLFPDGRTAFTGRDPIEQFRQDANSN